MDGTLVETLADLEHARWSQTHDEFITLCKQVTKHVK